jgi:hypothetical protein
MIDRWMIGEIDERERERDRERETEMNTYCMPGTAQELPRVLFWSLKGRAAAAEFPLEKQTQKRWCVARGSLATGLSPEAAASLCRHICAPSPWPPGKAG